MSKRRIETYIPIVQEFSSRMVFFHAAIAHRLDLHLTDLKALHLLGPKPMTAGVLAEQVGLTLPAVTALIDRLEKAGYVVRERASKDRRKVTVQVVPKSLEKVNRLYDGQYARMSKIFSSYSHEQFATIMEFLEKTNQVLLEEAATVNRSLVTDQKANRVRTVRHE